MKLLRHAHTGKLRSHEHTHWGALVLLLALAGFPLTFYTVNAASPGPEARSVSLSGVVPGKPPATGATITKPANGQHFSTTPITVAGTCPDNTLVELYKNDIFAGSIPCDSGKYSLEIDLLIGQNQLVARVYDALNQSGPDSNTVTVYYDALPPQADPLASLNFGGGQLILNTDAIFRGIFPKSDMSVPVTIIGGTPPYALNVQWGDTTNKVVSRPDNSPFKVTHAYEKAGVYQLSLQATDSVGRVAFLTVAVIVNGQPEAAAATTASPPSGILGNLLLLWPLYAGTAAVAVSFWLGEKREKNLLRRRGLLLQI